MHAAIAARFRGGARYAAVVATVVFALAGCGGGGRDGQRDLPGTANPPAGEQTTSTAATGGTESYPTITGAKMRVVNFFVPDSGTPGDVVVLPGPLGFDVKPVTTVPFGSASSYFEPPGQEKNVAFRLFPKDQVDEENLLISLTQTMVAGDQLTFVLSKGKNLSGETTGSVQTFAEQAGEGSIHTEGAKQPPAGKAWLIGNAAALQEVVSKDDNVLLYGEPGKGCLRDVNSIAGGGTAGVGGTQSLTYELGPGTLQLAAYAFKDLECSTTPVIPPVPVTLSAGQRVYAFAYGTSASDRKLLVVPVP